MGHKAVEAFEKWYAHVRKDPVVFAQKALRCDGIHNPKLTEQQLELLNCAKRETFLPFDQRKKRIAVKSGQGTGKTTCEVILALWRVFLAPGNQVIVTAPTQHQIKDVWFSELGRVLMNSHPAIQQMCNLTAMKCVIGPETKKWRILGKAASKPENFQGFHGIQMTVIVDEASGVDREIIRTIKGTLTNADSLFVCAGNPNTRECAFFDMFYKPSEAASWHKFTFNSESSAITDKENIRRIGVEFGTNSDVYRVRVLGEFPLADPNCVMSSEDLWACSGVSLIEAARMRSMQQIDKAISIDFARFGGDESVIYRRSGNAVVEQAIFAHTEPLDVVEAAFQMQKRAGWQDRQCWYVVDAGGMGQGVVGVLHRAGKNVHEFQTQHRASVPDYANKMTEAYFNVGKLAKERRIHIPDDEHLVTQLSSRLYKTDLKGKLILEKKDDYMKAHEGLSPDRGDCLAMLFYNAVLARGQAA